MMTNTETPASLLQADFPAQDEFVHDAISAWYERNDHVRCPFPATIREQLEENAKISFRHWLQSLEDKESSRMNVQEIIELFETILFHEATKLVQTDEEQITLLFPFMPRTGDVVRDPVKGEGMITRRKLEQNKDKKNILTVTVESATDKNTWQTSFELPV